MRKCSIIVYIEKDASRILSGIDRDSFIICADGGTEYALSEGIIPDLVIGDFDSYRGVLPEDIPRIVLPEEKDDTDTHYCVKYAMEQGFSDITVYGGLGGRFDHSVSNLQTLRYAAENGCTISLISSGNTIYVINSCSIALSRQPSYVSVFALSDICQGVTIRGAAYDVENAVFTGSFPIGTSNEFSDDTIEVSVKSGTLAVILSEE